MKRRAHEESYFQCDCCGALIPGPRVGETVVAYCPAGCGFARPCAVHPGVR